MHDAPTAATGVPTAPAFLRLLLADGRFPTGAHTQSAGLEPALLHGMGPDQVPDYIRARLLTVTEVEAATAVVARVVFRRYESAERERGLRRVDAEWRARTPSSAVRAASDQLARSHRRLADTLAPLGLGDWAPCRAVVIGCLAATVDLTADDAARMIAYDDVQTIIAATLKLHPFDPAAGVRWAADAGPEVEAMVGRVARLRRPEQIPSWSAPLIEEWAEDHQHQERRLFRA